jgi:hypothetical protein
MQHLKANNIDLVLATGPEMILAEYFSQTLTPDCVAADRESDDRIPHLNVGYFTPQTLRTYTVDKLNPKEQLKKRRPYEYAERRE